MTETMYDPTEQDEDEGHYHIWGLAPSWGVIIGLTRCKVCNAVATKANINKWSLEE